MEEKPESFEVCQCCTDPVYDDHREFEVDGKKACLKCWVKATNGQDNGRTHFYTTI